MANYNPKTVESKGKLPWTHDDALWFVLAPLFFVTTIISILIGGK
jgi:hypothetical protein